MGKPKKTLNFFNISQRWQVENCINIGKIHSNPFGRNNEFKIINLCEVKLWFSNINLQSWISKPV